MDSVPQNLGDFDALLAAEATLDWWREAGVDTGFAEDPTDWLAVPEDETQAPPPLPKPKAPAPTPRTALDRALEQSAPAARIGGEPGTYPQSLDAFRQWWMSEESLADGPLDRRLPPIGTAKPRLMVFVEQPYEDDGDTLLSGRHGKLAQAILRATGHGTHEAYFASIYPAALPLADHADLATRGFADIAAHHVALADPQRVLVFGRDLAPLFGVDPAAARAPAAIGKVPLLFAPALDQLARSAPRRARFWNQWLDWTAS